MMRSKAEERKPAEKLAAWFTSILAGWGVFLAILFQPYVAIFLGTTVLLLFLATQVADQRVIVALSALASLAAGVAGAQIDRRWQALTEETVIQARGKTSVRGLKDLFRNAVSLRQRSSAHLHEIRIGELNPKIAIELTRRNWEEMVDRCSLLEVQVLSSIENWTDAVPEVQSLIDEYQQGQIQVQDALGKLATVESQLKEANERQNKTDEEIAELRRQKQMAEENLQRNIQAARINSYNLGASIGGGTISDEILKWTGSLNLAETSPYPWLSKDGTVKISGLNVTGLDDDGKAEE